MTFSKFMHNMKFRRVRCMKCKAEKVTKEPDPHCDECGWSMITVLNLTDWKDPQ